MAHIHLQMHLLAVVNASQDFMHMNWECRVVRLVLQALYLQYQECPTVPFAHQVNIQVSVNRAARSALRVNIPLRQGLLYALIVLLVERALLVRLTPACV